MDGAAYDFSLAQNTDEVYIDGDHFEREACNESQVHSCSGQPVKVSRHDLSLEETVNTGIMKKHAEEMQLKLEMSNSVILDNKDLSFWVLSPNSDDLLEGNSCTKIIPTGVPSSGSVNILHSCASEVLDRKLTLGDGSAESAGGTAFNGIVEELKKLTTRVAHVLPVSDDGGSTAEIVRVSRPYRETIRAFLVYFQNEILHRPNDSFCFSLGIFFFAGACIFFQSLDAAIFLCSRVSGVPPESLVLPVISTNDRLTLGCELWDGTVICGQNEISHPTNGTMPPVNKGCSSVPALPARIKRVFYMSSEGGNSLHEVFPTVNSSVLDQLSNVDCIVYAMGSLFTSICPSLVLLLNGTHDRETSGFSASCFVTTITDTLNRKYGDTHNCLGNSVSGLIELQFKMPHAQWSYENCLKIRSSVEYSV
ncbi:hypothetical protein GH714_003421 [Hevea brasiliensis]|uniref:Uncharacterized protein n=1 Tax=Hevea brasiliensis TaxID=3981 RepID=A0A6A6LUY6_HEVBR|nr:hypothetical protein GH714_003421 [Hevea brasiliensis]